MRAWLFVLAVLATIQPIIQVASTEELESSSSSSSSSSNSNSHHISKKPSSNSNSYSNTNSHSIEKLTDPAKLVEVEKSLLSLFGFNKRPKVDRSKVVIPEAMRQLYEEMMGQEIDTVNLPKPGLHTRSANTVRSFTHEESKIDDRFIHHHRFRLYFNVTNIPKDEQLKAAELTLTRNTIADGTKIRHHILVYDILKPGIKGKREPIFRLIDSRSVRINETNALSLDVTPAVDRWYRSPKQNHGLLIHVSSGKTTNDVPAHHHIRLKRSTTETHETWAHNQPLLFTYTDDGKYKQRTIRDSMSNSNRPKRAPPKKRRRGICQRHPLYVDFQDVGWSDWIVAPPGYDAFYCQGECQFPMAEHLNVTNHAVVQTLVNSVNPNLAPKACCVPTHLSSMQMLYLDDQHRVVLKKYQDMVVVGCGCR